MAGSLTTAGQNRCQTVRRNSSALLMIASSLLAACGGGGGGGGGQSQSQSSSSSSGVGSATLAWDAVTAADLIGYRVYFGTAPGTYLQSPGQGLNAGNVSSYTITGLSSGTGYYFAATAYDMAGKESDFSNEALLVVP